MYTKEEFEKTAVKRGYASRGNARLYTDAHPKDEYTEDDLIDCYRYDARGMERAIRDRKIIQKRQRDDSDFAYDEAMQELRDSWL